jgi:dipeptidyl aminopeptidase/acylaminoacyl peptidase
MSERPGTSPGSASDRARDAAPAAVPYGSWASTISAQDVAAGALRLGSVALDDDDIYWAEGRPDEGGRIVVVRWRSDGRVEDVTPPGSNVRTRVHEYGGAAFSVSGGTLYYVEFADGRLYRLAPGLPPQPLTPAGAWSYADASLHPSRPWLTCVREDHTVSGGEPDTTLVTIALDRPGDPPRVVASGRDFYAAPRFSPDGSRLCWLAWDHPRMPWDGSEVWVADVNDDGTLSGARCVAGGETESIFGPGWSPDGTLYFASDRSGWWNLYRARAGRVERVHAMDAEFGRPMWQLGMTTWAFAGPARLVVSYQQLGRWRLATFDLESGRFEPVATDLEPGENIAATRSHAVFVGGAAAAPDAVVRLDLATGEAQTIRRAAGRSFEPGDISVAEAIEFPTDDGLTSHAFFYAPRNQGAVAPAGDRPPLIVISHGGPTASTSTRLNLEIQYWTTRGFAVADVNYGGSSGYGKAYRQRLNGQWGVVDVADCVNAARYLVEARGADPERLIIRGRSAGGYTTLAALAFRPGVFKAGASYYGISDLEAMARETHKFESHYLETLVGPYPDRQDLYIARSPIHVVDRLACPLVLFQGAEDRVVPPNQAEMMAAAIRQKGLPVALLVFPGEQHGFRRRETIARCLEAELFFYATVFGFPAADRLTPVEIENLDG